MHSSTAAQLRPVTRKELSLSSASPSTHLLPPSLPFPPLLSTDLCLHPERHVAFLSTLKLLLVVHNPHVQPSVPRAPLALASAVHPRSSALLRRLPPSRGEESGRVWVFRRGGNGRDRVPLDRVERVGVRVGQGGLHGEGKVGVEGQRGDGSGRGGDETRRQARGAFLGSEVHGDRE